MILQIINLISFLVTLGVNYFTIDGLGPFHSINNISNQYKTSVTPPNWTFSIWGFIYFGLLLFNIAQFFPKLGLNQYISKINYLFMLSCIFNIGWLLIFSIGTKASILSSIFVILGLLVLLLTIQCRLQFFKTKLTSKIIFIDIPFSIYLGWVLFATLANFGTCLSAFGYDTNEFMLYMIIIMIGTMMFLINLYFTGNYLTQLVYLYVMITFLIKYYNNNSLLFNITLYILGFSIFSTLIKIILDCRWARRRRKKNLFIPITQTADV